MTITRLSSIPEPEGLPEEEQELARVDGHPAAAKAGGPAVVSVAVSAGHPAAFQPPGSGLLGLEWPESPQEEGFLKRAGRRLRLSMYGWEERESYYRDSIIGSNPAVAAAASKSAQQRVRRSVPGLRRHVLPPLWQEKVCGILDTLSWNLFILAITIFAVFAPDIVTLTSAPDGVNVWINSFLVASMAVFGLETLLCFLCRPVVHWLHLFLDIISNLSLLFAITWFTDAVGVHSGGTTSDAASACRIARLVRIMSVLEILGWHAKQCHFRNNPKAEAALANQMAPTNIGKKIGEIAKLQVAAVVVAAVVCTVLILRAGMDTGSNEGLQAFVDSMAASAAAGATATQLQPTIDAMLAFSVDDLDSKHVPMVLNIAGGGYWNWVEQHGGWTARSTDRQIVEQGTVWLEANVAKNNHLHAGLNMALAGAVIVLLLVFVVHLNWTIWKMLVQPLDRIFHSIRTNAAQVVAALGNPEDEAGQGPGRGSKTDDLDIITIEAAVTQA